MMNLSAFCLYLTKYHNHVRIILLVVACVAVMPPKATCQDLKQDVIIKRDTVPDPATVWKKSALVPGWGQISNNQAWKVPVVYATLAGLSYYSITQNREYKDYRAAFYNSVPGNSDLKFGDTRPDLEDLPPELLRYNRNTFRNRRDLGILMVAAAWGLNVIDAYVFAQLRDFDTGPDLTFEPKVYQNDLYTKPTYSVDITLSFPLKTK